MRKKWGNGGTRVSSRESERDKEGAGSEKNNESSSRQSTNYWLQYRSEGEWIVQLEVRESDTDTVSHNVVKKPSGTEVQIFQSGFDRRNCKTGGEPNYFSQKFFNLIIPDSL